MKNETTGKNMPEKKLRAGPISVTVWKNQGKGRNGQDVAYFSVSLDRNYKDKEGNWKSTNSLRVNDLPKASLLLNKAYEHLVIKDKEAVNGETDIEIDVEEII